MLISQDRSSHPMQRYPLVLGFALGFLAGYMPFWRGQKDPFDELENYLIWFVALFMIALAIRALLSDATWKCAVAVGLGFPVAVIVNIIVESDSYQLPPLTIALALLVGMTASLAGAYCGKFIQQGKKKCA